MTFTEVTYSVRQSRESYQKLFLFYSLTLRLPQCFTFWHPGILPTGIYKYFLIALAPWEVSTTNDLSYTVGLGKVFTALIGEVWGGHDSNHEDYCAMEWGLEPGRSSQTNLVTRIVLCGYKSPIHEFKSPPWRRMWCGGIAPSFFLTSALEGGEWLASSPGRFTPGDRSFSTHWIVGWVGPWADLTAVEKKNLCPCLESNLCRPARRLVVIALHEYV